MRKAKGIAAIFAGLLLMFRAGAITVSADEGNKGNNGDVKIHATGTPATDHQNEPKVCTFYVDGFNFDKNAVVGYRIERWAPTGSGVATTGSFKVDEKGNGHSTPDTTLPQGHYKLFAKQTTPSSPGGEKQKVFWVECGTTANGQANTPPANNGGQQNNGSSGNGSGERSSVPSNTKSKGGSKSGTNSKSSKSGTKAGTKASNNASVASVGNNASGTNSMQTVSKDETSAPTTTPTTTPTTNNGGTPVIIPAGGITLPAAVTLPTTTPVIVGGITIPAGATITLPAGATITLANGTVVSGVIPAGSILPAGTVLPAGTTITGVLGFQSAPSQLTGAVSPEVEQPTAVNGVQTSAVNGEETNPVAGVTSLPATSTLADNGIWGALGLMLAGVGAFLLRKPTRRLN